MEGCSSLEPCDLKPFNNAAESCIGTSSSLSARILYIVYIHVSRERDPAPFPYVLAGTLVLTPFDFMNYNVLKYVIYGCAWTYFSRNASKMIHQRIFKGFPKYNIHLIRNDRLVCIFIDLYQQCPDEPGAAVSKGEVYYKQGKQFAWICEVKGVDCPMLKMHPSTTQYYSVLQVLLRTFPYYKEVPLHTTKYYSVLKDTTACYKVPHRTAKYQKVLLPTTKYTTT